MLYCNIRKYISFTAEFTIAICFLRVYTVMCHSQEHTYFPLCFFYLKISSPLRFMQVKHKNSVRESLFHILKNPFRFCKKSRKSWATEYIVY